MTRKDYVLIARLLNECFDRHPMSLQAGVRDAIIVRFKAGLAEANPNFDSAKFEAACLKGIK